MVSKRSLWIALVLLLGAGVPAISALSLQEAVEQSANDIAGQIPPKSRVAIVAFESPNGNLSEYIMDELTGALFDKGIEVADRRNLEYVFKELNFQMSGNVSDESAASIGKFLGAQLVITGQLISQGGAYRYRTSAIHVEKATLASLTRLDVQNDRAMKNLVASTAKQKTTVQTASYGVNEQAKPTSAGTFLDRGILFATRGDWELAIADFTDAIKQNPNLSAAYILRGRALFASVSEVTDVDDNFSGVETISTGGRVTAEQTRIYEQAIADFTQAIKLDPNNAKGYIERSEAYQGKGDYDRAIADCNQAIRLDPNYANAYVSRGDAYRDKEDYDRAIADFTQAIKLDPKNAKWYLRRGGAYQGKGDYDRAITDFTQVIRLDPNNAVAYYRRGIEYISKRDYDRAIADCNQAIRLDPNNAVAYLSRGATYYTKGDYDRAIADLNQSIRLDPNNAVAYHGRGQAYKAKGDYDRAIADYTQAIRLGPNDATYKQSLENARQARGR